jgi:hypothetical protein
VLLFVHGRCQGRGKCCILEWIRGLYHVTIVGINRRIWQTQNYDAKIQLLIDKEKSARPIKTFFYIYIYDSHAKLYRRKHATTYRIIIPTAPNLPSSSPTGCPMIPTIVMASVVTVVLLDIRIQHIIPKSSNASIGRYVRHGYNWYSSKYGPTFQT